jgi:diaminohydroxyphosphoribosylaminopyrimidine deaminase/5-amino-6-(5-phosphoribosylamino)uracil reductase
MAEIEKLMTRAFRLAEKGLGWTSPNPPVGAILYKDGEVVGAGYHRQAGLPHAEIEALKKAGDRAKGATLVVTLEPCSHFGKTPPCADAIIAAGVTKVVSATCDPNPVVCGRGYRKLQDSGIEVVDGVLREKAKEFYESYFKSIKTGLPFVTLKFAQSLDGRLATKTGHSQWISSPESLQFSHGLRAINDAILIGSGTLRKDNPQLTTRLVGGSNPIRVVLTRSGRFPRNRNVFTDGQSPTFVATSAKLRAGANNGFQIIPVKSARTGAGGNRGSRGVVKQYLELRDLLVRLSKMDVMSLLVEGGSGALTSFLEQRLADKIIVCISPIIIGDGKSSIGDLGVKVLDDSIKLERVDIKHLGPDTIITGYPVWK